MVANANYPFALEMVRIEKYFGPVHALKDINLQVERNEIVGLIGDNGAGKSTMVKILTGVHQPSSGELYVAGRRVDLGKYNVKTAHSYGIETVYQDKSLGEKQALWRNVFIGRQINRRFGFIDVKKEKEIAHDIMMNNIGFRGKGITVDSKVNKLSGGERQGIAIARAMYFEAEIIILDEPTVALSLKEVRKVLNFVHQIKEGGKACIYISHNLQDVYEISDRFVVLDRGEIVASIDKKDTSLHDLDEFLLEYAHGLKDKSRIMKRARSLISFLGQDRGHAGSDRSGDSILAFMITAPEVFLKWRIYMSFLQTVAPPLILGLGLTFVITAGEIDLSFPAVVAFSGYVFTWSFKNLSESVDASLAAAGGLVLALIAGAVVGYVNGVIVAKVGVPSIMVTLAAQFFWYGVTVLLAGGLQAALTTIENNGVHALFVGRIYGVIPNPERGQIGIPVQALWALGAHRILLVHPEPAQVRRGGDVHWRQS